MESFAFASEELDDVIEFLGSETGERVRTRFATECGYNSARARFFSVPEHYLSVINTGYYLLNEVEQGLDLPSVQGGQPDVVAALYSN